jgi:hypothetical protein
MKNDYMFQGAVFMKSAVLVCLFICISLLRAQSNERNPTDTLTRSLCNNQEQIVSKRVGEYRIQYFMGETELNMKTMKGFLSLNEASKPIYNSYRFQQVASWVLAIGGIGLIVADPRISRPKFPVISIAGAVSIGSGIYIGLRSNNTFFRAIYAHNKNICEKQ